MHNKEKIAFILTNGVKIACIIINQCYQHRSDFLTAVSPVLDSAFYSFILHLLEKEIIKLRENQVCSAHIHLFSNR